MNFGNIFRFFSMIFLLKFAATLCQTGLDFPDNLTTKGCFSPDSSGFCHRSGMPDRSIGLLLRHVFKSKKILGNIFFSSLII